MRRRDDDLDLRFSRVSGREDRPSDWDALRGHAEQDAAVWRRLSEFLEDDMRLRHAATRELEPVGGLRATAVELPATPSRGSIRFDRRWSAGALAWLVAACALFLWMIDAPVPFMGSPIAAGPTVARDVATPDPTAGREPRRLPRPGDAAVGPESIRELPLLLVATEPSADGSLEITYLRRVLERTRVRALEAWHLDERGGTWSAAIEPAALHSSRSF